MNANLAGDETKYREKLPAIPDIMWELGNKSCRVDKQCNLRVAHDKNKPDIHFP